ncbi:MAG TPA: ABC transporter substrate-binding protein [Steroidobacteraceae bacterium]|nr:ABC transporter substrate-binding protein [Steroidobacteraceae bacterium]
MLATGAAAADSKPMHVMSLNLCTDGLILDLLPAGRIASVTYLSRSPSNSFRSSEAARVPINYGTAEEALVEKPDLVLAGTYTTTATRAMLKRLGVAVLEVPPANSFEDIRAVTRRVGRALGEEDKAESLIGRMDATLSRLSAERPGGVIRVSGWNGGGSIPGKGTLFDAILTAAGGVNIASSLPDSRSGSFDIEELLMARPDVLAYGADSNGKPARRTDADQHPLILKIYKNRRVEYPEVLYSCGVPEIADAAAEFRAKLLAAMNGHDQP